MLYQQTFTNWEWLLVDDGSADNTAALVKGIHDERVRFFSYQPNCGRGHARSLALEKAQGEWMVIWDVDDVYFPDRLEQIELARQSGFDFCCSYAALINNQLELKETRGFCPDETASVKVFVHPTLACRLDLARQIGYDPEIRAGEDATMILTLAMKYNGMWIEDALTAYQEDREVNVHKAILSNRAQLRQTRQLYKSGLLEMNRAKYLCVLAKWNLKLAVLNLFRLLPSLFMLTVGQRDQGKKAPGWQMSKNRMEFLEHMRRRHNNQDWTAAPYQNRTVDERKLTRARTSIHGDGIQPPNMKVGNSVQFPLNRKENV